MILDQTEHEAVQAHLRMKAHLEAAEEAKKERDRAIVVLRRTMGVTAIARKLRVSTSTIKAIK